DSLVDRRKGAPRKPCRHALTADDKKDILAACNSPEYQSLPPSQIVPRLADKGLYLASESSFYRVLREHGQANRRGRAQLVTWYNTEHSHSGIKIVTPKQRHYGQEHVILERRRRVYEAAKQ